MAPPADQARIFVSIASLCDPMLAFTLQSAIATARFPDRLAFGIVEQDRASVARHFPQGGWRIAHVLVDPLQSRGACWARALAQSLWAGEEYFFQIDSHSLFEPGWDSTLIDRRDAVAGQSGHDRIILSTRPFGFEFGPDGLPLRHRFTDMTLKLVPKDPVLRLPEPVIAFDCINSGRRDDLPGHQISAANLFARGSLIEEVPYDPFLYFHGEEQNISIRAFTHGWDIWHPNAVPLYHLYKRRVAGEAPLHWDARFDTARQEKWQDLRLRARLRLGDLITGRLQGPYGLGPRRSFQEYLAQSGMRVAGLEPPATDCSA